MTEHDALVLAMMELNFLAVKYRDLEPSTEYVLQRIREEVTRD